MRTENKINPTSPELKEKYPPSATDDYGYQKTTDGQQKAEKKLEQHKLNYECYYCDTFTPTNNRNDYEKHIVLEHDGKTRIAFIR